jgi:hypothetical protein
MKFGTLYKQVEKQSKRDSAQIKVRSRKQTPTMRRMVSKQLRFILANESAAKVIATLLIVSVVVIALIVELWGSGLRKPL